MILIAREYLQLAAESSSVNLFLVFECVWFNTEIRGFRKHKLKRKFLRKIVKNIIP